MTEALVPAGWTIYGTRCRCQCHRLSGIRHFIACCSEKRDAPVAKSILSEQREADEGLCYKLRLASALLYVLDEGKFGRAAFDASARIRALSEALQEACHERDGLLVPEWQPIETARKDGADVLLWATVPPSDLGYIEGPVAVSGYFDSMDDAWCSTLPTVFGPYINPTKWMPLPTPPGEK